MTRPALVFVALGALIAADALSTPCARAQAGSDQEAAADRTEREPETRAADTRPAIGWLRVTGEDVHVRTRADLNSRIVLRLDRDALVRGVAREGEWIRVDPPPGTYTLVSSDYVERIGGDRGLVRITSGTLRVRVGSDVVPRDPMISEVVAWLENGDAVSILGEDNGWLRIEPPAGVYYYVSADYLEPVDADTAARLKAAARERAERQSADPPPSRPIVRAPTEVETPRSAQPSNATARETSDAPRNVAPPTPAPAASAPRRPAGDRWRTELLRIERAIDDEMAKGLFDRDWQPVIDDLRAVSTQTESPQVAAIAAEWAGRVEQRMEIERKFREVRSMSYGRGESDSRRTARSRGQGEFDVQGVLQPGFDVPAGPYGLRYKIVDPIHQGLRAYVEFPPEAGVRISRCLGHYVGVVGDRRVLSGSDTLLLHAESLTVLGRPSSATQPTRSQP